MRRRNIRSSLVVVIAALHLSIATASSQSKAGAAFPARMDAYITKTVQLTPAERRVAELAATGMSYKEIARRLDRSFSTIDHQLRSVRRKLGARSAGRLVRKLAPRVPHDG